MNALVKACELQHKWEIDGNMTREQFDRLNYTQKTEALLTDTFLADRLTEHHYIKLYDLESFYVEVFFDDATHLITHFQAFANTLFITPYLEELSITF